MKKVLSLFALCAMFTFAGCSKKKGEEKPKYPKKEQMKKNKMHKEKKSNYGKKELDKKKCKTCKPKKDMIK